jgi:uncharacterized membrane protein
LSNDVWTRIGQWFGWVTLIFIILIMVSGFAWDVRTSGLVSTLTGGILSRMVAVDLHTYVLIPLVLTLIVHVTLGVRGHLIGNGKRDDSD